MIIDLLINILNGLLSFLLLPLTPINFVIDFLSQFSVVNQFISIIAYVLPWDNIMPIIVLIVIFVWYRIVMSLSKLIMSVMPFI